MPRKKRDEITPQGQDDCAPDSELLSQRAQRRLIEIQNELFRAAAAADVDFATLMQAIGIRRVGALDRRAAFDLLCGINEAAEMCKEIGGDKAVVRDTQTFVKNALSQLFKEVDPKIAGVRPDSDRSQLREDVYRAAMPRRATGESWEKIALELATENSGQKYGPKQLPLSDTQIGRLLSEARRRPDTSDLRRRLLLWQDGWETDETPGRE